MTLTLRTPEELKQELDKLTSEQYEDLTDAIYFGMPPEKVRRMDARFARIRAISDELAASIHSQYREGWGRCEKAQGQAMVWQTTVAEER